MKKLIVTADDFCWTKSANEGIIRSATEGVVTDIAVMVLTDPAELNHGADLLLKNDIIEIGLHSTLFKWSRSVRPTRIDYVKFFKEASDNEIADRALSEIAEFEKIFGVKPKFISPQFNTHGNLRLLKVLADYVVKNNIPMRIPRALVIGDELEDENYSAEIYLHRLNVKMTNHLFAHIVNSSATQTMSDFLVDLQSVKDGESTELIFHPGYFDIDVLDASSLNYERARDLSITLNKEFRQKILDLGFTFCHMSDL